MNTNLKKKEKKREKKHFRINFISRELIVDVTSHDEIAAYIIQI